MSGRALWLLDVLSDTFRGIKGFRVDYVPNWETRGRNTLYPMSQVNHHTGSGNASYNSVLNYMAYYSSIAPLCNLATSRPENGVVRITVVAAGKANHGGRGYIGWSGSNNINGKSIGWEHQNSGYQQWPTQQNEAIAMGNAALMKYMGHSIDKIIDHKEWAPGRKSDRVHINPKEWRKYVQSVAKDGPPIGVSDVIVSKGAKGPIVERIQKDVNVLLTFKHLGAKEMSTQPKNGIGVTVDGDYGPGTAKGISQVLQDLAGVPVSGDEFGPLEAYIFTRFGFYADDKRHQAINH